MISKIAAAVIPCLFLFACGAEDPAPQVADSAQESATTEISKSERVEVDTGSPEPEAPEPVIPSLKDPKSMMLTAPDNFKAKFDTTQGSFVIEVHRDWAPLGADRFYSLVKGGFFDDTAFFRAVKGFMVQFGLNSDPNVSMAWGAERIKDDEVTQSNTRGRLTFAKGGRNSRTSQMFISYGNNQRLDSMGFAPVGEVDSAGMKVVELLYTGYGDSPPNGRGPNQQTIQLQGNSYLKKDFPKLDYIKTATIVE